MQFFNTWVTANLVFFKIVKCRKIEQMLPQLNKMVEEEIKGIAPNM